MTLSDSIQTIHSQDAPFASRASVVSVDPRIGAPEQDLREQHAGEHLNKFSIALRPIKPVVGQSFKIFRIPYN